MLRKRLIIETVNDQLKNITPIEHSRHRSHNGLIRQYFPKGTDFNKVTE